MGSVLKRLSGAVLLLATLGVVACGDDKTPAAKPFEIPAWAMVAPEPCAEDQIEILRRTRGTIGDGSTVAWIARAFRPLRAAETRITASGSAVAPITDQEGRRLLARTQVLLFGNRHSSEVLARARHRLIIQMLRESHSRPEDMALILECVPRAWDERLQDALTHISTDQGAAVRSLLQSCWHWPIESYVSLLVEFAPLGVRAIPIGADYSASVPELNTPDDERRPPGDVASGPEPWARWEAEFHAVNRAATEAARAWVEDGSQRMAVIDCGLLHHIGGETAILDALRKAGVRALLDVGFVKEVELALFGRFGLKSCESWFDLGSGMIRSPYVRASEIASEDW
jgi:hypothetical protein